MTTGVPAMFQRHNPDVLSCIANLSNDEVFTPPELANQMLDALERAWADSHNGASIWTDSTITFLDPFTKSGVFLREIVSRLIVGLESEFEDLQARVDHILTRQVFGIGITRLTSLLARRSVYCSKYANGTHSVASSFDTEEGNIWFERTEHSWVKRKKVQRVHSTTGITEMVEDPGTGRCRYCGAAEAEYARSDVLETHAYAFIHTDNIKARLAELFGANMQFDVIIGNPPYQLSDGGAGASAMPIYQKFVETARQLEPRYLTMVIPSRWFAGGRGLSAFRESMLRDQRLVALTDFLDSRDVFPSVDVAGGVCYFLWGPEGDGLCAVTSHRTTSQVSSMRRPLLEDGADVFIRYNEGISILRKVSERASRSDQRAGASRVNQGFVDRVSGQKPFGLRTFYRGHPEQRDPSDLIVLQAGGRAWASRSDVTVAEDLIGKWKVFTSKSSSEHAGQTDKDGRRRVLSLTGVLPPGTIVTETYILIGTFDTEEEAKSCLSYARTSLFRFLVLLRLSAQDIPRSAYGFVPDQDFTRGWTDVDLYEKYGMSEEEINFIESMIKPLELEGD